MAILDDLRGAFQSFLTSKQNTPQPTPRITNTVRSAWESYRSKPIQQVTGSVSNPDYKISAKLIDSYNNYKSQKDDTRTKVKSSWNTFSNERQSDRNVVQQFFDKMRPFDPTNPEPTAPINNLPVLGDIRKFVRETLLTPEQRQGNELRWKQLTGTKLTPKETETLKNFEIQATTDSAMNSVMPMGSIKQVGGNAVKPVLTQAQKLAKQKAIGLQTYVDDLIKNFGFTEQQANKVSYKQFTEMMRGKTSGRDLKSLLDEGQSILDPNKLGKSIGQIVDDYDSWANSFGSTSKPLKPNQKVNIIDYLRTPDRVLNKLGFGKESTMLRQAYDKYLEELPIEIDRISQWAKRVPESSQRIFQYLDGKGIKLQDDELQVAKEIQGYLKDWATKLGLPKDKQISSYITHLFPKNEAKELSPEVASLIRESGVAKGVYNPFLQKRSGKQEYIEDAWMALDAYVKRATRQYNMTPALKAISERAENLDNESFNYIKRYVDRINLRPTELENLVDTLIKSSPIGYKYGARPITAITQGTRQMVYRGLLGLNPASAIKNLTQGANTYSQLGEKWTLVGYSKVAQNLPKFLANMDTELNRVGILDNGIVQDRAISATKKFWQNADEGIFYLFNLAEKINRGSAYWGAKSRALSQGKSEQQAIQEGLEMVRKTQFTFGSIDTPALLQSDIMKTFAQFQSFTLKQGEFLTEMIQEKNIAGMIRWIASSLFLVGTIGKVIGMEPKDLIPTFRIGVPPTMQLPFGVYKGFAEDKDKYGNELSLQERIFNKDVVNGAMNYIPGGGQLRKTIEGTKALLEGGSYTKGGKLRYPTEGLGAVVFGSNKSNEAKEYYNGEGGLSEKETKRYKQLLDSGYSPTEAYEAIQANQTESVDQFKSRISADSEQKGIVSKVTSFVSGLFNKETETAPTVSDDPLIKAFNKEIEQDDRTAKIKAVFEMNLSKEETTKLLEQENLGTFEEASIDIMKSLGVENGNRGKFIMQHIESMEPEEQMSTLSYLADKDVLTTSVISQWLDEGTIDEEQAEALRTIVKKAKGTYKAPKAKKPSIKKLGSYKKASLAPQVKTSTKLSKPNDSVFAPRVIRKSIDIQIPNYNRKYGANREYGNTNGYGNGKLI